MQPARGELLSWTEAADLLEGFQRTYPKEVSFCELGASFSSDPALSLAS